MRRFAAWILAVPVIAWIYVAWIVALVAARRRIAITVGSIAIAAVALAFALPRLNSSRPRLTAPATASGATPRPIVSAPASDPAADRAFAPAAGHPVAISAIRTYGSVVGARTRPPTRATIQGTHLSGAQLRPTSTIRLSFTRPVPLTSVQAALRISPAIGGTLHAVTPTSYAFLPSSPLLAGRTYTVRLVSGVADADGIGLAPSSTVHLSVVQAPTLVALQPVRGTLGASRLPTISVDFSRAMDRATTARALQVVVASRPVPGSVSWNAGGRRLTFTPSKPFAAGVHVGVRLLGTAQSADGVPLARGGSTTFAVAPAPPVRPSVASHGPVPVPRSPSRKPTSRPVRTPTSTPSPKPVVRPGAGSLPASGTILGVDVSHHEGPIDWPSVAASGKRFALLKATEGTAFVDWTYASNRAAARAAGLAVGAFHYAQPDTGRGEATAEADHFATLAAPRAGDLLPFLDLEVTNGLSSSELQAWVTTFLDRFEARTGVRPGIYVSPDFWSSQVGDSAAFVRSVRTRLWVAHWTAASAPRVPASDWSGHGWSIWQYTDHGSVPGISRPADVDRIAAATYASLLVR